MRRSRYFRARKDATQKAIVDALRERGCEVYPIGSPCDLLVFIPVEFPYPAVIGNWRLMVLECKPEKRKRKDQPEQDDFLARTGTPRVRSPAEALAACGFRDLGARVTA